MPIFTYRTLSRGNNPDSLLHVITYPKELPGSRIDGGGGHHACSFAPSPVLAPSASGFAVLGEAAEDEEGDDHPTSASRRVIPPTPTGVAPVAETVARNKSRCVVVLWLKSP